MERPFISVDIETTSLDPNTGQILSIGAVIGDFAALDAPLESLPTFHVALKHNSIRGDYEAIVLNAELIRGIVNGTGPRVVTPENAATEFVQWLKENGVTRFPISVAGKNFAGFDYAFLRLLPGFTELIKTHHRIVDPGMLYFDPSIEAVPPGLSTCLLRAGLDPVVHHDALKDALDVMRLIRIYYTK